MFTVRSYRKGEEAYVADAHKRVYLEEYHWGPEFYTYAGKIAMDFAAKAASSREMLWVAESDGKLVGSVLLVEGDDPSVGQVRLFLVEKAYRKGGVGSALTATLLNFARMSGYQKLMLWTASPLTDAIHHYEKLGFRFVERTSNKTWSLRGEEVFEEKYEMDL
jgi:GNAT superfamily N-acetyltransferase